MDPFVGKYYSTQWIKRNVLRQSDDEIEEIEAQMKDEQPSMEELQFAHATGQNTQGDK
jgi:hypothetical protein